MKELTDPTQPPIINAFTPLIAPNVQPFQSYLPTAFSEEMTLLQKVNYVINYLNTMTTTTNGVIDQWNSVMSWVMGDGLTTDVDTQLTTWLNDGTLDALINQTVFTDLNNRLAIDDKAIGVKIDSFPLIAPEATDTPRILRALQTMTTGGVLVLNSATYTIGDQDGTIPFDNITIIGKGKSTLFKLVNNASLSNGALYAEGRKGFGLFNVAFDGNSANQTATNHMVRLNNCDQPTLENLYFNNVFGNCITFSGSTNFSISRVYATGVTGLSGDPGEVLYAQGASQGTISNVLGTTISDHLIYLDSRTDGTKSTDILMTNLLGVNCGTAALTTGATFNIVNDCERFRLVNCSSINSRCGFYFHENGTTGVTPSDYHLVNCSSYGANFAAGFYFEGLDNQQTPTNGKISNCVAKNNTGTTSSFGFRFENLDNFTIDNCDAIGNGANGFVFRNTNHIEVTGGQAKNNGVTSSVQGVKIGGDSTQNVQNLTLRGLNTGDTQPTKTQTYGVTINTGCSNIKVIGGNHVGNITGDVLITDPTTGEYIPDTNGFKMGIVLTVTANGADGTLSVAKGTEYVASVASSANGLLITLKNMPSVATAPVVIPFSTSSTGFGTSGSQMGLLYTRSASNASIEVGIKATASGASVPLNTCTVGSQSFGIFF